MFATHGPPHPPILGVAGIGKSAFLGGNSGFVVPPVPWKMRLEMVIGTQNKILIGIMKLLF